MVTKRVDIDRDLYGVMRFHEFASVGRWAASGRDGRPQGCAGSHPQPRAFVWRATQQTHGAGLLEDKILT